MIPKYYEYLNKTKVLAGLMALDNLPYELTKIGSKRPMVIAHRQGESRKGFKILTKAFGGTDREMGTLYLADEHSIPPDGHLLAEFDAGNCDGIIALGGPLVYGLGKRLKKLLIKEGDEDRLLLGTEYAKRGTSIPFIIVPMSNSGADIIGEPDLAVLDPRMTMDLPFKEIFFWGMDTLAHGIETYTSPMKNPMSDGYAYSAITLVRDNLPRALRCHRDKKARYGLAHAALLTGLAFKNTQAGLARLLAQALEDIFGISGKEALAIILPHYMETFRTRMDSYYGELLLPLAGSEIYADTPSHERGRKTIHILRSHLELYHDKYGFPLCLSARGVKRSDFDNIIATCMKSSMTLALPEESLKEDLYNILNLSF